MREATIAGSVDLLVDNRGRNPEFAVSGTPYLSGQSCSKGSIDWEHTRFVTSETAERLLPGGLRRGDVLLTSEAPMGVPVWVGADHAAVPGQRLFMLRANSDVIEPRFLYYSLKTQPFQAQLAGGATGTTVLGIRQPVLAQARLMLPSLRQQRAVAEVLGALDDKIAANQRAADLAEGLLRAKFDALGLIDEIEADGVLSDVLDLAPRRAISGEVPTLDMQALPTRGWSPAEPVIQQAKGGARFTNGDTLLARITPCLENRKTAYVDDLPEDTVGVGSTEFIVMRSREPYPLPLSFFVATDETFRSYAIQHMVGTSGRQRVSASDLAAFPIKLPGSAAVTEWGEVALPLFAKVRAMARENRSLAALRGALLPELMSGRLTVKDAESQVEEVV